MTCVSVAPVLESLLDGELDANRQAGVLEHMESCAACQVQYDSLLNLQKGIRAQAKYFRAPATLHQKVMRDIRPRANLTWRWKQLTIAACLLMAMSIGANILLLRQHTAHLAQDVFSAHMRSLMGTHLTDVISTDRHTVKPWFTGKLDFSPNVKNLATKGFTLEGGRVDYLDGRPVAALIFRRREHVINLFTWPSSDTANRETTHSGYNIIQWTSNGMVYWAVSDVNLAELKQFREYYRE